MFVDLEKIECFDLHFYDRMQSKDCVTYNAALLYHLLQSEIRVILVCGARNSKDVCVCAMHTVHCDASAPIRCSSLNIFQKKKKSKIILDLEEAPFYIIVIEMKIIITRLIEQIESHNSSIQNLDIFL